MRREARQDQPDPAAIIGRADRAVGHQSEHVRWPGGPVEIPGGMQARDGAAGGRPKRGAPPRGDAAEGEFQASGQAGPRSKGGRDQGEAPIAAFDDAALTCDADRRSPDTKQTSPHLPGAGSNLCSRSASGDSSLLFSSPEGISASTGGTQPWNGGDGAGSWPGRGPRGPGAHRPPPPAATRRALFRSARATRR